MTTIDLGDEAVMVRLLGDCHGDEWGEVSLWNIDQGHYRPTGRAIRMPLAAEGWLDLKDAIEGLLDRAEVNSFIRDTEKIG